MDKNSFKLRHIDATKLPVFGYKIHVSATWENYQDIKNILIPLLDEQQVAYKYLKDDKEVWTNFSVKETMAESGKFFTIYPENHQHFLTLLDWLYDALPRDWEGIYIMSDRPYKDSKLLFYRFGTIRLDLKHIKDGFPTLIGSNQEEWQDVQRNYFDLPSWIDDIQPDDTVEDSYLGNHYQIDSIKKASNGGNVYAGCRLSDGQAIVMKESRPHVLQHDNLKKELLRSKEYEQATRLNHYVPKTVEKVKEWLNTYYIYEEIIGEDFYTYIKSYTVFAYRSENTDDFRNNLGLFRHFLDMTDKLLELVAYFHQQNLILHDIHPDNLLIDGAGELYFVDLEYLYQEGDKPLSGIYHDIALKEWNGLDGKVADCHKVANLLLYCLARLQVKKASELKTNLRILHHLLENYGIKTDLRGFFSYLLSPNANIKTARNLLRMLKMDTVPADFSYELDATALNKEELTGPSFLSRVSLLNDTFAIYQVSLAQKELFRYQVDTASLYGLTGLLGSLILLKDDLPDELLSYGLDKVQSALVKTTSGEVLSIGNNCASPYIDKGNAGYIQGLMYLDKERYLLNIIKLADTIDFEFAQRPGYNDGMLGIADTLLDVYTLVPDIKYLNTSRKLLLNTSFYVKYGRVDVDEFALVLKKYQDKEATHAQTLKK
ncbi:hypothetical protein ACERC8_02815 [Streptococcus sp. E29BA]|uniref:class III lanthionine synthetase LanKC N-terminal domain-containing protein n=1 Tax=Streptococcus sp. E29BA TaxID=3278716 RepID=UPI00359D71A1